MNLPEQPQVAFSDEQETHGPYQKSKKDSGRNAKFVDAGATHL